MKLHRRQRLHWASAGRAGAWPGGGCGDRSRGEREPARRRLSGRDRTSCTSRTAQAGLGTASCSTQDKMNKREIGGEGDGEQKRD